VCIRTTPRRCATGEILRTALRGWPLDPHAESSGIPPGSPLYLLTGEAPLRAAVIRRVERALEARNPAEKLAARRQVIKSVLAGLDPRGKG